MARVLAVADQDAVAVRASRRLDAIDDLGEERVVQIVDDDAQRARATAGKTPSEHVRSIPQLFGCREHEGPPFVADVGRTAHHERHERSGHAGRLGDLLHRWLRHLTRLLNHDDHDVALTPGSARGTRPRPCGRRCVILLRRPVLRHSGAGLKILKKQARNKF